MNQKNRRLLRLAGAVLLGCLVVWGVSWWTHPSVLCNSSFGGNAEMARAPLGEAGAYASVAGPRFGQDGAETITFKSVTAHFATNTAHARATFLVCVHRPGTSPIGAVDLDTDLAEFCSKVRPITDGTTLHLAARKNGEPLEYVLIRVEPRTPGKATVDAVTFDYGRSWRHLWQRGKDRSTQTWIVRATP